jgi:hypothetical protein
MKPKNPLRLATICGLVIFLIISCKKKAQDEPAPATTTSSTTSHVNLKARVMRDSLIKNEATGLTRQTRIYTISYNADSTVKHVDLSIITYGASATFTRYQTTDYLYNPGGIVVKIDSISFKMIDTFRVDSSGLLYSTSNVHFSYYTGTDRILQNRRDDRLYDLNYFWGANNISFYTSSPRDTFFCDYTTDRYGTGDAFQLADFLQYGRSMLNNKNLVKSVDRDNYNDHLFSHSKYDYILDDAGRVSKMTELTKEYGYFSDTTTTQNYWTFEY